MLILTRRAGESIVVGDEVTITVLEMRGGQVKLGIDAPKEVAVHREEIYQRIAGHPPQTGVSAPSKNRDADSGNGAGNGEIDDHERMRDTVHNLTPDTRHAANQNNTARSAPTIKYKKSRS